jgi:3-deoxy-D-manno-octulosonic-acid transferase
MRETLSYAKLIAVRSEEDKTHFLSLGASREQIKLTGNIKFDIAINNNLCTRAPLLKAQWGTKRPVWVAASTHAGEDELLLAIYTQLKQHFPTLLLIIVPRHPERFADVEQLLLASSYQLQKRSEHVNFHKNTDIILGDSMGEMLLWYAVADIAFIGGSFVQTGGHNPLEAIALGIPVVSGPYTFNFNDIYPALCEAQIAWVEQNTNAVQTRIKKVLLDSAYSINKQPLTQTDQFKQQCAKFMQLHQGVVDKLLKTIQKYL